MVGFRPLFLALVLLALLPASAAANPATQIIVQRDPGLSASERRDVRADADVRFVENLPLPRTEVVAAAPGDVGDAVRDLNADPDVVFAEPDVPRKALAAECTPFGAPPCLWGVGRIFDADPAAAWGLSEGAGRTVAVVDSGVDATHEDLAGQVAAGWDFVGDDADPADEDGHGTHVSGTIAAAANDKGVTGVAPDAKVVPLRVLDGTGTGTVSDTIDAYEWVRTRGVRIVNASLGGDQFSHAEYLKIQSLPNVLFVVAAGNEHGEDNDDPATSEYPCAYGIAHPEATPPRPALSNILCVGASDRNDEVATFSNIGPQTVKVYAPGESIVSSMWGEYWSNSGTSMATPHVSATAALIAARDRALTMADVKQKILANVDTTGDGLPVLNARAALEDTDEDVDGDGWTVGENDNCPEVHNPDQEDSDLDGFGDHCDTDAPPTPAANRDGDALDDLDDVCPDELWATANGCPEPAVTTPDADHDGVSDARDLCPNTTEPGGFGCPDDDGDRVPNDGRDNCPTVANPSQRDQPDGDGQGDACDSDRDNDGVANSSDGCPETYAPGTPNGCVPYTPPPPAAPGPTGPADSDHDGIADVSDACPGVPAATRNGCALAQVSGVSAKARKRGKRRSATIRVATSDVATLRVTVERKKGRRWVRVTRRTIVTSRNLARLRVSRLKRGRHRVRISISSSAGSGSSVSKSFRVR